MRIFTNFLKVLLFLVLFNNPAKSRACTASFNYTLNANGYVTFLSTSSTNTVFTTYYWAYSAIGPTFSAMGTPGMSTNFTYTANGTYVVTLTIVQGIPSCTSIATATIIINNANPCGLNANFTYSQGVQGSNGIVTFSNISTGTLTGTTYSWSFGDNTAVNTATSPVHTYSANGTYIATLTVNNNISPTCTSTKTMQILVNSYCLLTAGFNYSITGNCGVNFYNVTTPSLGVTYSWNFGNGLTSTLLNPNTTYTANGTYTVTLISSNNTCTSSVSHTITINCSNPCSLNANFTYATGGTGLINFNNTTTGTVTGVSYIWLFGDNSQPSAQVSPAHTYSANGLYNVTLIVNNNSSPTCISTTTMNILVTCIIDFNFTVLSNGLVTFTNNTATNSNSLFPITYSWDFGNSLTSNTINPFTTYTASGIYTVTFIYSGVPCSSAVSHTLLICLLNTSFNTSPGNNGLVNFNNTTTGAGSAVVYTWNFGDNTPLSNIVSPAHAYLANGLYTVTLVASENVPSCTSTSTMAISVQGATVIISGLANTLTEGDNTLVYPNPTGAKFNIKINNLSVEKIKVGIYNIQGQKVFEGIYEVNNGKIDKQLDLGAEPVGIYFVEINTGNKIINKKIIVSR